ncbi:MAG: hypothetical protein HDR50_06610 [Desulfovibrio sp.]|uniref:hypothetical protein n=1 Tax=Desulfovibrio sp. TaxID=885 RepID=UPI001A7DBA1C|nr:hypothetical protein [Desulfovibrio sp.]MBD5417320.1 hypothetical protein [Desulfovibrio sp.]
MIEQLASERLAELCAAHLELAEAQRKVAAIQKRINELTGVAQTSQTHKPAQKTLSPKDFARGCGF